MLHDDHMLVCREDLLGAEVRLYIDNSDSTEEWAEARILALGASEGHPTEGMFTYKISMRRHYVKVLRGRVLTGCQVEFKAGGTATVWLSQVKCMLADGLVWAKTSTEGRAAEWLPGQVSTPARCLYCRVSSALRLTASLGACEQRYRHNTLCRHELGRRLAGFACVQLLPSKKMVWVPNKEHSLLPFDENLERLGTPTVVRDYFTTSWQYAAAHDFVLTAFLMQGMMRGIEDVHRLQASLAFFRARAERQQRYNEEEDT